MSAYFDEVDDYDHDYDDDDDGYDAVLGSLGEVINYGYAPPASSASPASSYNTVSDDECASSGSPQSPPHEFTIWDSVRKPDKKTRTPAHNTRSSSTRKKAHTQPSHASSSRGNAESVAPVEPIAPLTNNQPHQRPPEPEHGGIDSNTLLWLGGSALVLALVLRGK